MQGFGVFDMKDLISIKDKLTLYAHLSCLYCNTFKIQNLSCLDVTPLGNAVYFYLEYLNSISLKVELLEVSL